MKTVCSFFVLLLLREASSGIVRKPPAFSTPVYSDSYLPAAMQIIFHAVEQLKALDSEEVIQKNATSSPLSTLPANQKQQLVAETSTVAVDAVTKPNDVAKGENDESESEETTETTPETAEISESYEAMEVSNESTESGMNVHQESPEMNEETPETNYATPESNYESPEDVHGFQETNQEVPEKDQEESSLPLTGGISFSVESSTESEYSTNLPDEQSTFEEEFVETTNEKKKEPTVDSVVEEIYEIVKPTTSESPEKGDETSGESKSPEGLSMEKMESIEEEEDETRFTLLGEKVAQVPRPSLTSYLRRAKVPPSASLQQLANLYDALSKDARKQGFGKYTGYSDEVLKTLVTSAEGGIGPQLNKILGKVIERNELTREDARMRTTQAIRDLDDYSSTLNKDLRRLLPLRYSP